MGFSVGEKLDFLVRRGRGGEESLVWVGIYIVGLV